VTAWNKGTGTTPWGDLAKKDPEEAKREMYRALFRAGGSRRRAAEFLGVSDSLLEARMHQLDKNAARRVRALLKKRFTLPDRAA